MLDHPDDLVGMVAAYALARYDEAALPAVPALGCLLSDPAPAPRDAAGKALRHIYRKSGALFPQLPAEGIDQ